MNLTLQKILHKAAVGAGFSLALGATYKASKRADEHLDEIYEKKKQEQQAPPPIVP